MVNVQDFGFFKKLTAFAVIEKIILFGSRARGDAAPRADIDLAVLCPTATMQDWLLIVDIVDDADTLLKIDLIRVDTLSDTNPLQDKIQKDGVVLYVKT